MTASYLDTLDAFTSETCCISNFYRFQFKVLLGLTTTLLVSPSAPAEDKNGRIEAVGHLLSKRSPIPTLRQLPPLPLLDQILPLKQHQMHPLDQVGQMDQILPNLIPQNLPITQNAVKLKKAAKLLKLGVLFGTGLGLGSLAHLLYKGSDWMIHQIW